MITIKIRKFFTICILVSIIIFTAGCTTLSNSDKEINECSNIEINIKPTSILIRNIKNPTNVTEVSNTEDISKIVNLIQTTKVKEKSDRNIKGWSYSLELKDDKGNSENIELLEGKILYGDFIYETDLEEEKNLEDICSELSK